MLDIELECNEENELEDKLGVEELDVKLELDEEDEEHIKSSVFFEVPKKDSTLLEELTESIPI